MDGSEPGETKYTTQPGLEVTTLSKGLSVPLHKEHIFLPGDDTDLLSQIGRWWI
jgi:hypothetical protein